MNPKVLLVALFVVAVGLAGCADSGEDVGTDSTKPVIEEDQLGNRGGIQGLVVDDNYRPVQLKEDWGNQGPGDFQDIGFVIILETAQRFETNENGEFAVAPLEPGTYTVRVAADNHEAIDRQVNVVAGEFAEVTVEARRTFSGGGTTLTQEYTMFDACSVRLVAIGASGVGCGDNSGDGSRSSFSSQFEAIEPDIRGMVTEMRAHQDGWYRIQIRNNADCGGINGCIYWIAEGTERYYHSVLYPGLTYQPGAKDPDEFAQEGQPGYCEVEGQACGDRFYVPEFGRPFNTILFPEHPNKGLYEGTPAAFLFGAGVVLGTKAQFLQTVFLYELPDEGLADYCALCDDADIPE